LPIYKLTFQVKKPDLRPYPKELKTIGDHLKKRRLDLNMQQKDVASKLKVTICTLRNWERGRSSPRIRHLPKIANFLGYRPQKMECGGSLGERMIEKRQIMGLSQKRLATEIGVDPCTIRYWEKGKHKPSRESLRILAAYFAKGGLLTNA
jgi:transcriptional regulator with XRE-family HTH domain